MNKNKIIFGVIVALATIYIYNAGQAQSSGILNQLSNLGKGTA